MNKIVSLYLSQKNVPARLDVVQGATLPAITFVLEDFTPTPGSQCQIFIKKKNSEVYNTCTLEGNEVTFNPSTGTFDEVGPCVAQLEITDTDYFAISFRIYVNVEPNIIDTEAIEASDDFSALQDAIAAIGDLTELRAQVNQNTTDVASAKAKTDLLTINSLMRFDMNSSLQPYLRWTKTEGQKQLSATDTGLLYQTNDGSGWTTAWTMNAKKVEALGTNQQLRTETVSLESGTAWKSTGKSITLDPGTWVVNAGITFSSNATGVRKCCLSATDGGAQLGYLQLDTKNAVSGQPTPLGTTTILTPTAQTTYYLSAMQNSGSALNCYPRIFAVRLI